MPPSFEEILSSHRLFRFVVGGKADGSPTEFRVHEEAIAQLSGPLISLMQGEMLEARDGCAEWPKVSKDTFVRLSQFAYTGDYTNPTMEKRETIENAKRKREEKGKSLENGVGETTLGTTPPEPQLEEVYIEDVEELVPVSPRDEVLEVGPELESISWGPIWGAPLSVAVKKNKKAKNSKVGLAPRFKDPDEHSLPLMSGDFNSLSFPLLAPRNNYACEPDPTFHPDLSYSNAFKSHAALFILADYRLVDSLKALALYKLHKTLCAFQLNGENAEDIFDLASYVYSEGGGGFGDGLGDLRALVCRYMATHALVLSFNEVFMEILGEGGQFVKDFFKFEVQRTS